MRPYIFRFVPRFEVEKIKKIYGLEDNGHSWNHINDVLNTADVICGKLKIPMNKIVEYACLYHDISLPMGKDRKTHHIDSANIFIEMHPTMGDDDKGAISQCIKEHRSSVGGCSTQNSEIVASADNGIPSTTLNDVIDRMVMRSVRHHMHVDKSTVDNAITEAINHIGEKYGPNGYCEYPALYIKLFRDELRRQTEIVSSLKEHEQYVRERIKSNI